MVYDTVHGECSFKIVTKGAVDFSLKRPGRHNGAVLSGRLGQTREVTLMEKPGKKPSNVLCDTHDDQRE